MKRNRLTERISIRLSKRLAERLSEAAEAADQDPGAFARETLRQKLLPHNSAPTKAAT
jgi:predicted transcriptional regulator